MKNKIDFIVHNKCNFLSRIEVGQILCLFCKSIIGFYDCCYCLIGDDTLFEKSNFI